MKPSLILLSLAYTALSTPLSTAEGEQAPFHGFPTSYPGFTLDLSAQRLVQTEGGEPVWMTEMDKVFHLQIFVSFDTIMLCLGGSSQRARREFFRYVIESFSCYHAVISHAFFSTETRDLGEFAHLRLLNHCMSAYILFYVLLIPTCHLSLLSDTQCHRESQTSFEYTLYPGAKE